MPNSVVQKVANVTGKPEGEIEDLWKNAVAIAKEEYGKRDYAIIMGIFKKSLGEDTLKKLKWEEAIDSNMSMTFEEFLDTYQIF